MRNIAKLALRLMISKSMPAKEELPWGVVPIWLSSLEMSIPPRTTSFSASYSNITPSESMVTLISSSKVFSMESLVETSRTVYSP